MERPDSTGRKQACNEHNRLDHQAELAGEVPAGQQSDRSKMFSHFLRGSQPVYLGAYRPLEAESGLSLPAALMCEAPADKTASRRPGA